MQFKIGDKVWVKSPTWCEECTVYHMAINQDIMYVHRANGNTATIYKSWASPKPIKNQQLVFDFMR
jgi:hypothetical protein